MVRRLLASLTGLLTSGLMVFCACRQSLNMPPRIRTGAVSDIVQVIELLPESGAVAICKNGYRVFNLDALVEDDDDPDSTLRWSLSPGPLLEVRLDGTQAEIVPVPNQTGNSQVVFTATDPGGLSTSRTCPIEVFDDSAEFSISSPTAVEINAGTSDTVVVTYQYMGDNKARLEWTISFDASVLTKCVLDDPLKPTKLRLTAGMEKKVTGIYFEVRDDSVNHVSFSRSIPVTIK